MTYPPSPQYGPAAGSDPSLAYGSDPGPVYGSDPGPVYGSDPGPVYGSDPAQAYGSDPGPVYGSDPAQAYGTGTGAVQAPAAYATGPGPAYAPGSGSGPVYTSNAGPVYTSGTGAAQAPTAYPPVHGYGMANYASAPLYLAPAPPQPTKSRRGLIIGIVAGAAAIAVAASVGMAALLMGGPVKTVAAKVASVTSATLVVKGTLDLHDDDLDFTSGPCAGQGGYSDISVGAAVTITDGTGAIVALGRLGEAELVDTEDCTFQFSVPNVPAGKGFYGIEVSHRGSVKYAEADLATPLSLTLGS